jgi:hypothetical protein
MPAFFFKVSGDKELVRQLGQYREKVARLIKKRTKDAAEASVAILREYPPVPRGSRYVRTGELGRGYLIQESGANGYKIKNAVTYSVYVVGDKEGNRQAWMHAGRWRIARTVVNQEVERQRRILDRELKQMSREF